MTRILLSLSIALSVSIAIQTYGQGIKVGQPLPNLTFDQLINCDFESIKIEQLKGKAILLDFWNTHCTACFAAFPKLDSLQKRFNGQLHIILVNQESKETTVAFFKKHKNIVKPNLLMLTSDTLLTKLFPGDGYPYTVWINKNGIVQYFSGAHSVSEKSIDDFLNNKFLAIKDPTIAKYGHASDRDKYQYVSSISFCLDSLNIGNTESIIVKDSTAISISCNCVSVIDLYKKAYNENNKHHYNKRYNLIADLPKTLEYFPPLNSEFLDEWQREHSYNYELLLPIGKQNLVYKTMQDDLNRFFGLEARVETRLVNSLVLRKKVNNIELNKKRRNNKILDIHDSSVSVSLESSLYFFDLPFKQFVRELRVKIENEYPFYDETGFNGRIKGYIRKLSIDPLNASLLTEDLDRLNFELRMELKEIQVLVLRESLTHEK